MERISWNQYFMAQSHLLALRSTCERLMVGATIVRDKRIIAGGYNGSVTGGVHCIDDGCYLIEGHCVRTVHAEANALLQCAKFGAAAEGSDMYVTHFPCLQCTKQIIQSGIRNVFYATDYRNHEYAVELFAEAGVETIKVELDYLIFDDQYVEKSNFVNKLIEELKDFGVNPEKIQQLEAEKAQLFFNQLNK